jgi:hypothetical protein
VTQEIFVPAINGGACAPQTLTYRGELCPITTVSPTATPTVTPTARATVTPTVTPTATPTATPTCALSLPAAPQCPRGSVCVERDRCGQCIGWRCKCVDTKPPDTHGRTGCYRPGWPQTKVVCARGVTNWSGGWSGAFTYVYSSSYGIKSSKDEGTVCWQCVCERAGGSGCFAPDTKIVVKDRGGIDARDIKVGDLILNPKTKTYARVQQVVQGSEKEALELHFDVDGKHHSSKLSFEHVMVTERGYVRAAQIVKGDKLLRSDGFWAPVLSVEKVPARKVINFVLNPSSTSYEDHLVESDGLITGDLWLQNNLKAPK